MNHLPEYPGHAEIEEIMRRARVELSLEIRRLLGATIRKLHTMTQWGGWPRVASVACAVGTVAFVAGLAFAGAHPHTADHGLPSLDCGAGPSLCSA